MAGQPGFSDDLLTELVFIDNNGVENRSFRDFVTDVSLERSIDRSSSLTVSVRDPDRRVIRDTTLFRRRSKFRLGELEFVWVSTSTDDFGFQVEYEDALIARLRRRLVPREFRGCRQGALTRSEFVRRILRAEGVDFLVQPDPTGRKEVFAEGDGEEDDVETVWEALQRLASEATSFELEAAQEEDEEIEFLENGEWLVFSTGTKIVFASERWLGNNTRHVRVEEQRLLPAPTSTASKFSSGVVSINWTVARERESSRATVRLRTDSFFVTPGFPVRLNNQGPASQFWLLESVRRGSASSPEVVLSLRRVRTLFNLPIPLPDSAEADFVIGELA